MMATFTDIPPGEEGGTVPRSPAPPRGTVPPSSHSGRVQQVDRLLLKQLARLRHRVVAAMPDDHVVKHADAQEPCCANQGPGQHAILTGWGRAPARMRVGQDDRWRAG